MTTAMIRQYTCLTEFLGTTLGPDYEIILHDLSDTGNSIIAIANEHISGRKVGAPLTNVALKLIADKVYETQDFAMNYSGVGLNGQRLRSSTMFIKDEENNLVGLLCINFDDSRYDELSKNILQLCHPRDFAAARTQPIAKEATGGAPVESFYNSISDVTEDVVGKVIAETGVPADRLTQEEKMEIVDILDRRGVFLLKGSVKYVAECLYCSQASIYRYLSKVGSDKK